VKWGIKLLLITLLALSGVFASVSAQSSDSSASSSPPSWWVELPPEAKAAINQLMTDAAQASRDLKRSAATIDQQQSDLTTLSIVCGALFVLAAAEGGAIIGHDGDAALKGAAIGAGAALVIDLGFFGFRLLLPESKDKNEPAP